MGAWDTLDVGRRIRTPGRTVSEGVAGTLIALGGYTHPMFNDAEYVRERTPFGRIPLPGEVTLLFMGGLAEQVGVFDETVIALVGMTDLRFERPAFPGDTLALEMEVVEKRPSARGARGAVTFQWNCLNQRGERILSARVTLLFRVETAAEPP